MKAFIIHTPHEKSKKYAQHALASFNSRSGWEPELFEGVTAETLPRYEQQFPLKIKEKSRAAEFLKQANQNNRYHTKKSCSYNHYRLFRHCISLNEPIAIIEHDSHCIGDWKQEYRFDDVLIMNVQSALKRKSSKYIWHLNQDPIPSGITDVQIKGLVYRHDPSINGATMMPGTAAYAITPKGARTMIDVYENIGWEQSDFIINTAYVRIQNIIPELFTFVLPNLETSHGVNL